MNWLKQNRSTTIINISVIPRSSKSEIVGIYNDCLKIKLQAPPVDNAANEELVRFLAARLKIPKKNIEIIKGHNQKKKIVCVTGCNVKAIDDLKCSYENF